MADAIVAAITAMGFDEAVAHRGIQHVGLDLERAIEWILMNGDDCEHAVDSDDEHQQCSLLPSLQQKVDGVAAIESQKIQVVRRLELVNAAWEAGMDPSQLFEAARSFEADRLSVPEHAEAVDPHRLLLEGTPLRVAGKPREPRGRWFEVLAACPAGTDLLIEPAYVAPAQFTVGTCCHCLRVRGEEEHTAAASQYRCHLCNADETSFCSELCKERWSRRHEVECPLIEPLLGFLFDTPGTFSLYSFKEKGKSAF